MKMISKKYRLNVLCISLCLLLITACSQKNKTWEYKILSVGSEGHSRDGIEAGKFASISPSENEFNALGKQGWELVGSYLEMETAWVNFGREEYTTGLQPNIRPQRVVFIFKRLPISTVK